VLRIEEEDVNKYLICEMAYKRKSSSRRGGRGKRSKVVRKLTASSINRALTSVRSFRGQEMGRIFTTATNSDYPIRLGPIRGTVSAGAQGSAYFSILGQTLFSQSHLMAIAQEAMNATAVPATMVADPLYAVETNTSANPLKFYGHWIKVQIRNVALNPVKLDIYDIFPTKDFTISLVDDFQNNIFNFMLTQIYNQYYDRMNATDVNANFRMSNEAAWVANSADAWSSLMSNDWMSPVIGKGFNDHFDVKRHHKIVLAPGQSYVYNVKGFRPYMYYPRDNVNNQYVKDSSWMPLIRSVGEIGMSSENVVGFTPHSLAVKMDYGIKCYKTNALQHQGIGSNAMKLPDSGVAILGPSDDVLV